MRQSKPEMKTRIVIVIIISLALSCCTRENASPALSGSWVDIDTHTDTLNFLSVDGQPYLHVDRGTEFRDGFLRPKSGSGPYNYNLDGDTISLRWLLSSDSRSHSYYFKQSGHQLTIGRFFDATTSGSTLTFSKIE